MSNVSLMYHSHAWCYAKKWANDSYAHTYGAYGLLTLDLFHYRSTFHDEEEYDGMLLYACRLSGYLIAIPIPKPRHKDKDENLTWKRAAHFVMERWVDRFGAPREERCP